MKLKSVFTYVLIGALTGALYETIRSESINSKFMMHCIGCGALGGLIPGLLREGTRRFVPVLQSWAIVPVLIFLLQYLLSRSNIEPYWTAILYAYLMHLMWEGYRQKLPKV